MCQASTMAKLCEPQLCVVVSTETLYSGSSTARNQQYQRHHSNSVLSNSGQQHTSTSDPIGYACYS